MPRSSGPYPREPAEAGLAARTIAKSGDAPRHGAGRAVPVHSDDAAALVRRIQRVIAECHADRTNRRALGITRECRDRADTGNNAIRRITPDGFVSTLAGDGTPGDSDGATARVEFTDRRGRVCRREGHRRRHL